MLRTLATLAVALGLSACASPNPLFGLSAETEAGTTSGGETSGALAGTGRTTGDAGGASTLDDDGDPTADPDSDTGPRQDIPAVEPSQSPCCDRTPMATGCEDAQLESCVCDLDPFCCTDEWDETCVDVSIQDCGAVCFHKGSCCTPSNKRSCADETVRACVCDIRPECCDVAYDIECVNVADTQCVMGCFVGDNECCTATPDDVGCNDSDVWNCVCPPDPFCCEFFWDALCVGEAIECGMCPEPTTDADCCEISPAGGCADQALSPGVMNCVCAIDESCCTTGWTLECILLGEEQCTLDCSK